MKTKILSFILFAILLIFTSCGDGTTNSGNSDINDNPQFEKSVLDSITVKTLPTKTQYSVGETLDPTGLVLQGNYIDYFSDGSTQTSQRDIDYNTYKNELAFSPTNLSTEGSIKITVTYNKKSTTFNITVGKSSSDSEYPDWFQEAKIGGEDSPIKIRYVDALSSYKLVDKINEQTAGDLLNYYQDQYQKHIESLTFSDAFKAKFSDAFDENGKLKINFPDFFDNSDISTIGKIRYQRSFDPLIGHYDQDNKSMNGSLNDICKPMIEEITKNIGISGDDYLDIEMFCLYNRAIYGDAYNYAYSNTDTYTQKKEYIQERLSAANLATGNNYKIYEEDGTIHKEALQRYNDMKSAAVTRFNDQCTGITKEDVDNVMILSSTISAIQGTHDLTTTWNVIKNAGTNKEEEKHGTANCATNEMVEVIENVQSSEMTS